MLGEPGKAFYYAMAAFDKTRPAVSCVLHVYCMSQTDTCMNVCMYNIHDTVDKNHNLTSLLAPLTTHSLSLSLSRGGGGGETSSLQSTHTQYK